MCQIHLNSQPIHANITPQKQPLGQELTASSQLIDSFNSETSSRSYLIKQEGADGNRYTTVNSRSLPWVEETVREEEEERIKSGFTAQGGSEQAEVLICQSVKPLLSDFNQERLGDGVFQIRGRSSGTIGTF